MIPGAIPDDNAQYAKLLDNPEPIIDLLMSDLRYTCNILGIGATLNIDNNVIRCNDGDILEINKKKYNLCRGFEKLKKLVQPKNVDYVGQYRLPLKTIENYTDEKERKILGQGVSSKVYSISNEHAIKVVEDSFGEISLLIRLWHRNIINIVDVIIDENPKDESRQFSLILPRATCSLKQLIQNNLIRNNKLIEYVEQLLSGLYYLQQKNVWHRDIKPENILYFNKGDMLKITDFGLSSDLICKTKRIYSESYTINYKPVEHLENYTGYENISGDIWAMGCVLAEIITGKILFLHYNPKDAMQIYNQVTAENKTLDNIYRMLGTPENKIKGKLESYLHENSLYRFKTNSNLSQLINLITRMVAYPQDRITITELINHEYLLDKSSTFIDEIELSGFNDYDENAVCEIYKGLNNCEYQLRNRELYASDQAIVTSKRDVLFHWLYEFACSMPNIQVRSLFLAFYIFDRYCSVSNNIMNININDSSWDNLYRYAFASLNIGDYISNDLNFRIRDEISKTNGFTEKDAKKARNNIVSALKFDFNISVLIDYIALENDKPLNFKRNNENSLVMLAVLVNCTDVVFNYGPSEVANIVKNIYYKKNIGDIEKNVIIQCMNIMKNGILFEEIKPYVLEYLLI